MSSPLNIAHIVNKLTKTSSVLDQVNHYDVNRYNTPYIVVWLDHELDKDVVNSIDKTRILLLGKYNTLKKILIFIKFIKKNNVLLLHCHHTKSGFWSRFIARICGIKNIYEDGGGHPSYTLKSRILLNLNIILVDKVVCVSEFVYDSYNSLEKLLVPLKKVCFINYGADRAKIKSLQPKTLTRNYFNIDKDSFLFIHTGRFVEVKNQRFLFEIINNLILNDFKCELLMVGEGPLKKDLINYAIELNIRDSVHFTGLLARKEVYELLNSSDALIMTSKSEGLSVSLVEAIAAQLPAVLTDIPSFRETMKIKNSAIIIDSDMDHNINVRNIIDSFNNENFFNNMINGIDELYEKYYNVPHMMNDYQDLYDRLLNIEN
jgi:glycosyltransferase involved in cell wall biosynthesis